MKNIYIPVAIALMAVMSAKGQQTLTQNISLEIQQGGLIACAGGSGGITVRDNRYFRFFKPADHGITDAFEINNVQFGIGVLGTPPATGFPVIVKVFLTEAGDFPVAFPTGYQEVANLTVPVFSSDLLHLKTVPLSISVPAGFNIVMQVGHETQPPGSNTIGYGRNTSGETAPAYWSTDACSSFLSAPIVVYGDQDPVNNIVMVINGPNLSVEDAEPANVSVYPNPTNGLVNIHLNNNVIIEKAVVTDIQGKIVVMYQNPGETIDVSDVKDGMYFLTIYSGGLTFHSKLLKH